MKMFSAPFFCLTKGLGQNKRIAFFKKKKKIIINSIYLCLKKKFYQPFKTKYKTLPQTFCQTKKRGSIAIVVNNSFF